MKNKTEEIKEYIENNKYFFSLLHQQTGKEISKDIEGHFLKEAFYQKL